MFTKEQLLELGPENLANIILSIHGPYDEIYEDIERQIDIIHAWRARDAQKLTSILKEEIVFFDDPERSIKSYYCDYNIDLVDRLDKLRINIADHLAILSSGNAFELILKFIDLQDAFYDGPGSAIEELDEIFEEACYNLEEMCSKLEKPLDEVVDLIFVRLAKESDNINYKLISIFRNILQKEGYQKLRSKLEQAINKDNTYLFSIYLQDIADYQDDVDGYIRACSMQGKPTAIQRLDIAERCANHGRIEEAIKWLESADLNLVYDLENNYERIKNKISKLQNI